jgi:adenine-specific DNA methylase
MATQYEMFQRVAQGIPPTTRYQGSKLKLLPWIWHSIQNLKFETVLDAFGGTGCVSFMLKAKGKRVTFNDYLRSNYLSALALIENKNDHIEESEIEKILRVASDEIYHSVVVRNFKDIYFTDEENHWLDIVTQNIRRCASPYRQALAYHALFQSCIIKRPYNLFHRKNLYMRVADVERNFGNKVTWDTPFPIHFRNFLREANEAVFDTAQPCQAHCQDVLDIKGEFDLVYIDPPYLNSSGIGVDYFDYYHFLEGLADYETWEQRIDRSRKHHPLQKPKSLWSDARTIYTAFTDVFEKFSSSTLVVSYRSDGIPSETELVNLLKQFKKHVSIVPFGEYKYVLSKNGTSKELLFIAQ